MIRKHHRFMMGFTRSLLISLRRPVIAYLVTLSLSAQLGFAGLIYVIESDANSKMNTFFDAFYFTVTLMTGVGLGDLHPITMPGRMLAIVMMLCGTGIYVCFTAVLAALILETEERKHESESTPSTGL